MRPRLKPYLSWSRSAERVLTVQGGGARVYLEGEPVLALAALLPALDGATLEEAAARAGVPLADARELVETLAQRGLVDDLDADAGEDSPLARALAAFTATPRAAAARLRTGAVCVLGQGMAADATRRILAETGVAMRDDGAFVLLAEDAPTAAGLDEAARRAAGRPWTRVTLDGPVAWVGPTVAPGHACHACFRERSRGQAQRPETLPAHEDALAKRPRGAASLPSPAYHAAAMAAQEAVLALSGARPPMLLDRAAELLPGEGARVHPVLRVVGCPGCGGPPA